MTWMKTAVAAAAALLTAGAAASEWQSDLKLKLGGFAEGARDLGIAADDPGVAPLDETSAGIADAQWSVLWRDGEHWAAYLRAQGFATSDELTVTDEDQPRRTESYLAAREFWLQYGGLMGYPGEYLRFGRQRVRAPDGTWWDQDIESLRWVIDTTLLQAQFGIAEAFSSYRTQDADPALALRDRAYAYGSLDWEWTERNRVGVRATHAFDHVDLDEEFAKPQDDRDRKLSDSRLSWIGVHLLNDFYSDQQRWPLAYWLEATYLFGQRSSIAQPQPLLPPEESRRDISAWSLDAGLRGRLKTPVPVQLGLAYAFGSGGGDAGESQRFEQTGLHSNRSRFVGTRSLSYRYGEALQPDLSNLHVASAFVSLPLERYDASLVYHQYWRDDDGDGITVDGVDVQPAPDAGHELGRGYDLVLTHYFGSLRKSAVDESDDLRSNVRLRGSLFEPSSSYSRQANDDQYRVTLEVTLWF